jgi:type II secretory pathway pseudopilin PulG
MLVVIGIILILAGILVPLVGRSWNKAKQTSMAFDMQAVATALEAYNHDVRHYPIVSVKGTGSKALADALIAPADQATDGQAGPGFRLHTGGKVYGPYLQPDKFKVADGVNDKDIIGRIIPLGCLLDSNGSPILYYPAHAKVDISQPKKFIDASTYPVTTCLYNYADNDMGVITPATTTDPFTDITVFEAMMGDLNGNGGIEGTEKAAYTGDYLLWSAGPDGLFGLEAGKPLNYDNVKKSDDVTNFQR